MCYFKFGLVTLVLLTLMLGTVSCGSQSTQLSVTLTNNDSNAVNSGSNTTFVLSVINKGPGAASNTSLKAELPSTLRYKATSDISTLAASRVQPIDPGVNSNTPTWGLWSLAAPRINADGTKVLARIDVTFSIDAAADPGNYLITPKAASDSVDGDITGSSISLQVKPSPMLTVNAATLQPSVSANQTVEYRITVTNSGTGPASGVNLLVTLPPTFQFVSTENISGNSGRSDKIEPVLGALEVFYGTFNVPARTNSGPGTIDLLFKAKVSASATANSYAIDVQALDAGGDVVLARNTAKVTVASSTSSANPLPKPTASIP